MSFSSTSAALLSGRVMARGSIFVAIVGASSCALDSSSDRIAAALIPPLSERFVRPTFSAQDSPTGIITLGGGTARTIEAMKLARRFPGAKLVITGAADLDYNLARAQGLGHDRLIFERKATNTFENALFTKRLVAPESGERWLLVTSATHMPRAIGSFRANSFPVEPWPIQDVRTTDDHAFAVGRHEWLGLIAYRLLGRSDTWFPGPVN